MSHNACPESGSVCSQAFTAEQLAAAADRVFDRICDDLGGILEAPPPEDLDHYVELANLTSERPWGPFLLGGAMGAAVLAGILVWWGTRIVPPPAAAVAPAALPQGLAMMPQPSSATPLAQGQPLETGSRPQVGGSSAPVAPRAVAAPTAKPRAIGTSSAGIRLPRYAAAPRPVRMAADHQTTRAMTTTATPMPVRVAAVSPGQSGMRLVGILQGPGQPMALIMVDNVMRQVPLGRAVKNNWLVTSISPYAVGVSNGHSSMTLQLGLPQNL